MENMPRIPDSEGVSKMQYLAEVMVTPALSPGRRTTNPTQNRTAIQLTHVGHS